LKLSTSHAGSLSSSGSVFQTVGPATGKAVCAESTARHSPNKSEIENTQEPRACSYAGCGSMWTNSR